MSVQALSPFSGAKRLFEEEHPEDTESPCDRGQHKRGRFVAGSPSGRCSGAAAAAAFGPVHPSTLNALRALFPGMDDQAVTAVLAECGNDIDAAIRRLNQLRIEVADSAAAAAGGASAANGKQQQQQQQQQDASSSSPDSATAAAAAAEQRRQDADETAAAPAAAAAAAQQPQQPQQEQQAEKRQQQQQQQQQQQDGAAPDGGPQTAEQWVDALVAEMAQASSIPDARARAGRALHAFEQFVLKHAAASGAAGAAPQLQARLDEAARENAILKRAVQIQNARMQEVAAAREHEVGALKAALAAGQERLRQLEMANYSLALHLQKAAGGGGAAGVAPGHRPPDVY